MEAKVVGKAMSARLTNGMGLVGTLCAVLCLTFAACKREEKKAAPAPLPQRVITVVVAVPPEAYDVAQEIAQQFNVASSKLDGDERVNVEIREGGAISTGLRLAEGKTPLGMWLAPSSLAVGLANRRGEPAGVRLEQCTSLMSTAPAVVFRASDAFQVSEIQRPVSLSELFARLAYREKGAAQPPVLVGGAPLLSTSGFAGLLMTAAMASKGSVGQLRTDVVMSPDSMAKRTELLAPFVHFFTSDRHMLSWLRGLDGGRAVLALTTLQQFHSHALGGDNPLEVIPIDTPALTLDYPLCMVGMPYQRAIEREAARVVQKFFTSDHVQEIVKRRGFKGRLDALEIPSPALSEALESLLSDWPQRKSPSAITVVLDTSTGVKGTLLKTLSKHVAQIAQEVPGNRGITGLITCSQLPEKVIVTGGTGSALSEALEGLHTTGGLAFRDCLLEALQVAAYNTATTGVPQRREIVALISSDDTSSQTSMERFMQSALQIVRQSRPGLHVIGIGTNVSSFGGIPQMVQALGGRFFLAPPGEPLANVIAQVSQVIE